MAFSTKSDAAATSRPVSWASLALFGAVGLGTVGYYNYMKHKREVQVQETVTTVGEALLGGPFELVDADGVPVTDAAFKGKHTLIYFGFTFCPDICPNELVKMGRVLDKLAENKDLPEVVPIFITVDPYRDSVDQLKEYMKDFHPRMVALTGTPQQIQRVTKSYRVYFSDVGHRDDEDDEDYVVDHSIVMYFMGPDGKLVDYYPQLAEVPEIVEKMSAKLLESKYGAGHTRSASWLTSLLK